MGGQYAPMNPMWADGFARRTGRKPTQGDWEKYQDFLRRGGKPESTAADAVAPYASAVGSAAGIYAASKLPGLFAAGSSATPVAAGTAGATTAAGTAAATGAGAAGASGAGAAATGAGASTASTLLPALGTAALGLGGAAGLYDVVDNFDNMDPVRGGLQGSLAGAALGFALGGPVGALIGAGGGGLFGAFAHKPQTEQEEKRWRSLVDEGLAPESAMPAWVREGANIKHHPFRTDLDPNFVGFAPTDGTWDKQPTGFTESKAGDWVNNKFGASRNESDLRPEDIWGYASMIESFGPDYLKTSEENRRAIAQKLLDLGLVDEHHGTIDINATPEAMDYWKSLISPTPAEVVQDTAQRLYNKGR